MLAGTTKALKVKVCCFCWGIVSISWTGETLFNLDWQSLKRCYLHKNTCPHLQTGLMPGNISTHKILAHFYS